MIDRENTRGNNHVRRREGAMWVMQNILG